MKKFGMLRPEKRKAEGTYVADEDSEGNQGDFEDDFEGEEDPSEEPDDAKLIG